MNLDYPDFFDYQDVFFECLKHVIGANPDGPYLHFCGSSSPLNPVDAIKEARGCRNTASFVNMTCFICDKPTVDYPQYST